MNKIELHNSKIKRPFGMAVAAFEAYIGACNDAGLKAPRIVQTVGKAKASAGTHHADGISGSEPYCAAVDISVRGFLGLGGYNEKQIRWLLFCMARRGFVGWYRYRGSFANNRHVHAIYVGLPMKPALQFQVRDFLLDRDGLASHRKEVFWTAETQWDARLRAMFLKSNPGAKGMLG